MEKERFKEIIEKYNISDDDARELLTLREGNSDEWRRRYEELHKKYIDTFFGGAERREESIEVEKEDSSDITIEELRERIKEDID